MVVLPDWHTDWTGPTSGGFSFPIPGVRISVVHEKRPTDLRKTLLHLYLLQHIPVGFMWNGHVNEAGKRTGTVRHHNQHFTILERMSAFVPEGRHEFGTSWHSRSPAWHLEMWFVILLIYTERKRIAAFLHHDWAFNTCGTHSPAIRWKCCLIFYSGAMPTFSDRKYGQSL